MKFGKTFVRAQVTQWSRNYANYKVLKQLIKKAAQAERFQRAERTEADTSAAFLYALDREVEKVDRFFNFKCAELDRRVCILQEKHFHINPLMPTSPSVPEISVSLTGGSLAHSDPETDEAFFETLLETKDALHKVMRFGELNVTAFRKILKKYDKRVKKVTQEAFLAKRILCLPFAKPHPFDALLDIVENLSKETRLRLGQHQQAEFPQEARKSSQTVPTLTANEELDAERCLEEDNDLEMEKLLQILETRTSEYPSTVAGGTGLLGQVLTALLYKACARPSYKCIAYLLERGASISPQDDINGRTLLHRLAISGGILPTRERRSTMRRIGFPLKNHGVENMLSGTEMKEAETNPQPGKDDPTLVSFILDNFPTKRGWSLPDLHGRRPLHYAALNGYANIAKVLVKAHLQGVTTANNDNIETALKEKDSLFTHPCWCDNDGYTPLFYAVLQGHTPVVRVLIEDGGQRDVDIIVSEIPNSPPSASIGGISPIMAGSTSGEGLIRSGILSSVQVHLRSSHTPLAIACKLGHFETSRFLARKGANVNHRDDEGETPLHAASKGGFWKCVAMLTGQFAYLRMPINDDRVCDSSDTPMSDLDTAKCPKAEVDARENVFSWTPLFFAAVEGHLKCTQILLQAGANASLRDISGWNPHEQAVFRGHMRIAALLKPLIQPYPEAPPVTPAATPLAEEEEPAFEKEVEKTAYSPDSGTGRKATPKGPRSPTSGSRLDNDAQRAYGHRYLDKQSMIIVTLGTTDSRHPVTSVELYNTRMPMASFMPATSVSLVISASNAAGEPATIDLPVRFHPAEPAVFYTDTVEEVVLKFDIMPTYGTKKQVIGRAVALLASVKTPVGKDRTPLAGSVTVPIVGSDSLDVIGTVVFEFLVIKPFSHALAVAGSRTYWKSVTTKVIGHRGFGANRLGTRTLQVGENTLLSFITAASLGAEYVEFDVQLTKDKVPIIYHDWNVSETGVQVPVSAITHEEFLNLRSERRQSTVDDTAKRTRVVSSSVTVENTSVRRMATADGAGESATKSHNSEVVHVAKRNDAVLLESRALRSVSLHIPVERWKGAKNDQGKMRGSSPGTVQAPFVTLQEALQKVPMDTGFNIELKYPMVDEAQAYDLREAYELNVFVDAVLQCVYDHSGTRSIIFSSFHPDVCMMLSCKQPNYPVFFLTDAGTNPMADVRCQSIREAVCFAKTANLLGIVSASDPIIEAPNLVETIKEAGLLLFTYGASNNDVASVRLQRAYGVDAVIVDQVVAVRKGLQSAHH